MSDCCLRTIDFGNKIAIFFLYTKTGQRYTEKHIHYLDVVLSSSNAARRVLIQGSNIISEIKLCFFCIIIIINSRPVHLPGIVKGHFHPLDPQTSRSIIEYNGLKAIPVLSQLHEHLPVNS